MPIQTIKKRNGQIVQFDRDHIESAMQKAFASVGAKLDDTAFRELSDGVLSSLEERFTDRVPGVEDVQNVVEMAIADRGFFDVARSYIIYRYEHQKEREKKQRDLLEKLENNELLVIKRNGARERFSLEKLKKCVGYFTQSIEEGTDVQTLVVQCRSELYEGITTKDIYHALIMTVRSFIEQDPAYSKLAARLLNHQVLQEIVGEDFDVTRMEQQYRESFVKNIKKGVELQRLDPRLLYFDLEGLSQRLVLERDDLLLYLGAQTLADRYFLQDPYQKKILETPQAFWMRVAMGMSLHEDNKNDRAKQFYDIISTLRFVPTTPTLFHAGTIHPQMSACYLNTVTDSLDHIFKVIGDNAQLSKWSGGIGTDWTNLRGTGALIKGTGVESQGVIPFLKVANDTTHAINRSGRRRGAACVYLETWHIDIEDFLELKKNTGDERRRTHDMDTANWIPDLFMKRVRDDAEWTLFSPDEVGDLHHTYGRRFEERYVYYEQLACEGKMRLTKTMKARDLWKKMLAMLFETGHPWMTFKDAANVRSPQDHVGVIHNSNLCTEITLNTSADETAVCNLGSVNLAKHIKDRRLDVELLRDTVTIAMRMLDNVIDINFYPTKEAQFSNLKHRPVGLGLMGFQDALYMLDIKFDSEECVEFADQSMEVISYYAILGSVNLAKERGSYQSFRGSKWDRGLLPLDTIDLLEKERGESVPTSRVSRLDWEYVRGMIRIHGMRNSNCMAIAPTATISNIAGSVPSIEPIYKNLYVKSNQSGDFIVINPYLVEDLKKFKLWDCEMLGKIKYYDGGIGEIHEIPESIRAKYKEVFDIEPKWLIKAATARGKWIDQSQSLNIFFTGSSGKVLNEIYLYAWMMGLKTTYYLRTLAASQVEKSTVNTTEYGSTHNRNVSVAVGLPEPIVTQTQTTVVEAISTPVTVSDIVTQGLRKDASEMMPLCKIEDPTCESCQ